MERLIVFLVAFLLIQATSLEQEPVDIVCVPIQQCPKLLSLLTLTGDTSKIREVLKTSQCGLDGKRLKVWCPQIEAGSCTTPEGIPGTCTPTRECQPFLNLLRSIDRFTQTTQNYLQKFACPDANSKTGITLICCPAANDSTILKVPNSMRPSFFPTPGAGECGLQLTNKIIGGKVTEMDEFPWTVLLKYRFNHEDTSTSCGGSLISNKYVVTAAHCVEDIALRSLGELTHVVLGEFDTRTARDCINSLGIESCNDPPIEAPVEQIIIHPQWYGRPRGEINHDIALIRLAISITFTNYIRPICLPSATLTIKEQEKFVVAGWGQTENGTDSFVKLKTTIPMANKMECAQKYRRLKKIVVGDGEICAGGVKGMDTCTGDSGGPLMLYTRNGTLDFWILVGVVSFGPNSPCGVQNYPALYTFLPKYVDWIYETVQP